MGIVNDIKVKERKKRRKLWKERKNISVSF